jgi:hypothetical protein
MIMAIGSCHSKLNNCRIAPVKNGMLATNGFHSCCQRRWTLNPDNDDDDDDASTLFKYYQHHLQNDRKASKQQIFQVEVNQAKG